VEDIERKRQFAPGSVATYEQLFFNVLDRLDNRGYIVHQVIAGGVPLDRALEAGDDATIWKLYGYARGVEMLEAVLYGFSDWHHLKGSERVADVWAEDYRASIRQKAALAARTMPVNARTAGRLIELQAQLARAGEQAGGGEQTRLQANIEALFSTLKLTVARPSEGPGIEAHNEMCAGLRAGEMLAAAMGRPPDMDRLRSLEFPPQPQEEDWPDLLPPAVAVYPAPAESPEAQAEDHQSSPKAAPRADAALAGAPS
jgi:hypothetical protein